MTTKVPSGSVGTAANAIPVSSASSAGSWDNATFVDGDVQQTEFPRKAGADSVFSWFDEDFLVPVDPSLFTGMFTALTVTRLVFDYLLTNNKLQTIRMQRWIKETSIDFLSMRNWGFALSWILILVGLFWIFHRGHEMLGVDFAGGDS